MTRRRWAAAALVAGAASAGSAFHATRAAAPLRAGGYYMLAADFHVHAFPGDGALPSWELAREASRRGLHAIVISNHNQTPKTMPGLFFGAGSPLLLPAQEVTTPRFHLIAVGIRDTIDWRGTDLDIVGNIHAQGGVVIAAHPIARYWRGGDAMLPHLDGVEVAHPLTGGLEGGRRELSAFFARARAVNPAIAPVGSSDFHMIAPLGACRTYVFAESISMAGILDAIRAGRTVAQDQEGALYGDPALTALVRDSGAAASPPVPRRLALVSALLVLMGFAGLVIWE